MQNVVRRGAASEFFKVGDQLVSMYDGKEITWDVIGIDHDIPTDTNFTHSMTLQTHDCICRTQFDEKEPSNSANSGHNDRTSNGNNRYIHSAVK